MWRKTIDRPKVKEPIIILTDNRNVMCGYMNEFYFTKHEPGKPPTLENKPSYSFHGSYYDFTDHKQKYCLVNAIAWMPMPDEPTIKTFEKK